MTDKDSELKILYRFVFLWSDWQRECYSVPQEHPFSLLVTIPSMFIARMIHPLQTQDSPASDCHSFSSPWLQSMSLIRKVIHINSV